MEYRDIWDRAFLLREVINYPVDNRCFNLVKYYSDQVRVVPTDFLKENFKEVPEFFDLDNGRLMYVVPLLSFSGNFLGYYFRDLEQSVRVHRILFLERSVSRNYMFSFYTGFKNKKYEDPVILVEGIIDTLVALTFHPYSIGILGNALSMHKLKILSTITNAVYYFKDLDLASDTGALHMKNHAIQLGLRLEIVNSFGLKDLGQAFDSEEKMLILKTFLKVG